MAKLSFGLLLGMISFETCTARADDDASVTSIVNKAIEAAGGTQRVAKLASLTWSGNGVFYGGKKETPFKAEAWAQGWNRVRMQLNSTTVIVDSRKVWFAGWRVSAVEPTGREFEFRDIYFVSRLAQMPSFLLSKDFRLSYLGTEDVFGQPSVRLRIDRKDRPEFSFPSTRRPGYR